MDYINQMSGADPQIAIYIGDTIENAAEAECLRRLQNNLEQRRVSAVILANIVVGRDRRQIDCIVATETTAVVVEIKRYLYPVRGEVNGPWMIERRQGKPTSLGTTNPYHQALTNRYAVIDMLTATAGIPNDTAKRAIAGMLCIYPSQARSSRLPDSNFKLSIGSYADLLELLEASRTDAIGLQQWHDLARRLNLRDSSKDPSSDARRLADGYCETFLDFAETTSTPYIEPRFKGAFSTDGLAAALADGERLQIVGQSGSGKSELAMQIACNAARVGNLPVWLQARNFDGKLAPLLRAAAATHSSENFAKLFNAAWLAGAQVVLFVDGINECPTDKQTALLAALQAARIRYELNVVLTGQKALALPKLLQASEVELLQPDLGQAERLVSAHAKRQLTASERSGLEVIASAQDAALFAALIDEPAKVDGRFALYANFIGKMLGKESDSGSIAAFARLAANMRSSFVSTYPLARAEGIVEGVASGALEIGRSAGLLKVDADRVAFRHDLFADFLAARDILRETATAEELSETARRPLNAELREFILGGCATLDDADALIARSPDSRLLRGALAGRSGERVKQFVLERVRDLIGELGARYERLVVELPQEVDPTKLSFLDLSFPVDEPSLSIDGAYLDLLPLSLGEEHILDDLLGLFRTVDAHLASEAKRLRNTYPDLRIAWERAVYGSVYGMAFGSEGRDLQALLNGLQNSWFGDAEEPENLGLSEKLANFETLSPGQLFLLVSALRSARKDGMPERFPQLLEHIWHLSIYHLRLQICDIIVFRGRELPEAEQEAVRDALNSYLSDTNIMMNSMVIDALGGVDGIETTMTVEDAVAEYEAMLEQPETAETRNMAISAVTRTYDHPFCNTYWEAFYDHLALEKRHALLLRGLRSEPADAWFTSDILRALHREPTPAAEPELQFLAQAPMAEGHSYQYAVNVFADSVALLAKMNLELATPDAIPSDPIKRAWLLGAPLLYALNAPDQQREKPGKDAIVAFRECGASACLDVIQLLIHESRNSFGHDVKVDFEKEYPELVLGLCRAALKPDYQPASIFKNRSVIRSPEEDHAGFALSMMQLIGRKTDVQIGKPWLDHRTLGETALRTLRALEKDS